MARSSTASAMFRPLGVPLDPYFMLAKPQLCIVCTPQRRRSVPNEAIGVCACHASEMHDPYGFLNAQARMSTFRLGLAQALSSTFSTQKSYDK